MSDSLGPRRLIARHVRLVTLAVADDERVGAPVATTRRGGGEGDALTARHVAAARCAGVGRGGGGDGRRWLRRR